MKQILILLSILLLRFSGTNAQVAIVNDKENIAYIGVDNPFSFAVFDYPCMNIDVKVDNGTLIKVPKQCGKFIYKPAKVGMAKFSISGLKNKQIYLIDIIEFRVVNPPLPTEVFLSVKNPDLLDEFTGECCASIHHTNASALSVTQLANSLGLGCTVSNFNYPINYIIKKFDYSIQRNKKTVKEGTNNGANCSTAFIEDLKSTQAGDVIIFDNILAAFNNEDYKIQRFQINITN